MKNLLMSLIVLLLIGCSHSGKLKSLEYRANYAESITKTTEKQIIWLTYRGQIKNLKPSYPNDIKILDAYFIKRIIEDMKFHEPKITSSKYKGLQIEVGLIPVPIAISKEHGRLYVVFRNRAGDSVYLQVHKQNVTEHDDFDDKIWKMNKNLGVITSLIIAALTD